MLNKRNLNLRALCEDDPPVIATAFAQMGWTKPETQFRQYLDQQAAGIRTCLVAIVDRQFAGYVTVNWRPSYPGFIEQNIPEIQDLNILQPFREQGVATRLLDHAESEIARHSRVAGISVGLHPGYNAAQRLYVKRGYIPDGRGVTYRNSYMNEGAHVALDDELLLHFTKQLGEE